MALPLFFVVIVVLSYVLKIVCSKFLDEKQGDKVKNATIDYQYFNSTKEEKWGTRFLRTRKSPKKECFLGGKGMVEMGKLHFSLVGYRFLRNVVSYLTRHLCF